MIDPALLARIPGAQHDALRVTPLAGGSGANHVWHVTTRTGSFVLRLRLGPLQRPGADPLQELAAHRAAAAAGLAPPLVDWAEDGRWLLMEHVPVAAWTDTLLRDVSHIEILGRRLRSLHALPPQPGIAQFDARRIAAGQVEILSRAAMPQLEAARRLQQQVGEESARFAGCGAAPVLNHGDLQASNVLGPQALLIDWEYAQCVDPVWDIACLLNYYPFLDASLDVLLSATGLQAPEVRERLGLARQLFARLDALWHLVARARTA